MRTVGLGLVLALWGLGVEGRAADAAPEEVQIVVDHGYTPSKVTVQEGTPLRLTFLRKDYSGCTKEVVFPTLGIKRELPVNKPVVVDVPPQKPGEVPFQCGMAMLKGSVVVTPAP